MKVVLWMRGPNVTCRNAHMSDSKYPSTLLILRNPVAGHNNVYVSCRVPKVVYVACQIKKNPCYGLIVLVSRDIPDDMLLVSTFFCIKICIFMYTYVLPAKDRHFK